MQKRKNISLFTLSIIQDLKFPNIFTTEDVLLNYKFAKSFRVSPFSLVLNKFPFFHAKTSVRWLAFHDARSALYGITLKKTQGGFCVYLINGNH